MTSNGTLTAAIYWAMPQHDETTLWEAQMAFDAYCRHMTIQDFSFDL
jgi:hypothetical protein